MKLLKEDQDRKTRIDFLRGKIGNLQNYINAENKDKIIVDQGIKDTIEGHLQRYTKELEDLYNEDSLTEAGTSQEIMAEEKISSLKDLYNSIEAELDQTPDSNPKKQIELQDKLSKISSELENLKTRFGYVIDNTIEESKKKKSQGWFVKYNAGDVEKGAEFFNKAMGNEGASEGTMMEEKENSKAMSFEEAKKYLKDKYGMDLTKGLYKDIMSLVESVEKCALCGKEITGYGNNGQPLVDGRVCDECNKKVIEARINQLKETPKEESFKEKRTINIRESLNNYDKESCSTNLLNMYDSCKLTLEDKKQIVRYILDEDYDSVNQFLTNQLGE